MAKERSRRAGFIGVTAFVLLTLLFAPGGVFVRVRVFAVSLVSSLLERSGFYTGYTTRAAHLERERMRLVALLKRKEADLYELQRRLDAYGAVEGNAAVEGRKIVHARVVFHDPSAAVARILVDAGTAEGVRRGAVVLDGMFLLGKVVNVSASSAEVLLLTDTRCRFAVFVGRKRFAGILAGRGKGRAPVVEYIENQPENVIRRGDPVETSGFLREVPARIPVGEVANDPAEDTAGYVPFVRVRVKPYVNLSSVKDVFIVVPGGGKGRRKEGKE